ncbi:hypothetical protein ILP97_06095 [Amycolatopsis sp. H6(2020)]|nr:hypothetical protein [Amycolatopsis sp. H6(2020)]
MTAALPTGDEAPQVGCRPAAQLWGQFVVLSPAGEEAQMRQGADDGAQVERCGRQVDAGVDDGIVAWVRHDHGQLACCEIPLWIVQRFVEARSPLAFREVGVAAHNAVEVPDVGLPEPRTDRVGQQRMALDDRLIGSEN